MNTPSDDKLDRLLQDAYPAVEVSSDFTLRLWRRLMKKSPQLLWRVPVPVAGVAVVLGIVLGLWTWEGKRVSYRWDLFGNAPFDTVAGSYLKIGSEI